MWTRHALHAYDRLEAHHIYILPAIMTTIQRCNAIMLFGTMQMIDRPRDKSITIWTQVI